MMDFAELDRALARAGALMGASQTHGTMCGLLCTPEEGSAGNWLDEILGESEPGDVLAEECGAALHTVYHETLSQLNSAGCVFDVLLPSDDEELGVRAAALRDWCAGFLFGLGIGGVRNLDVLPDDSREIIGDITAMTRMDDQPEPTEEQEEAYAELVEYIRVGVMLIRAELVLEPSQDGRVTRLH